MHGIILTVALILFGLSLAPLIIDFIDWWNERHK